jgi:hypothetical protein
MIAKSKRILLAAVSTLGLLSACAGTTPGVGTDTGRVESNPGGLSPQRVYAPPQFKDIVWLNVGSFEAVPEDLAAAGKEFCGHQNTDTEEYKAVGYHRYAMDTDSYPIKGGGYYCEAQAKQKAEAQAETRSEPAAEPKT